MNRPVVLSLLGLAVALAAVVLTLSLGADDERRIEVLPQPTTPATGAPPEQGTVMVEVVRIGEKGDTVIAGRADPASDIVIDLAGQPIGAVLADSRGEWVFVPTAPLPEGVQLLTLGDKAGGPRSHILALIAKNHGGPAHTILIPPQGRLRVLSGPSDQAFAALAQDRDQGGRIAIAGRAEPGRTVQAWFGARTAGRTQADADGNWLLELPAATEPTIRVEALDSKGKAMARLELTLPTAALSNGTGSVVQLDATSWRIVLPGGRVVHLIDGDAGH